MSGRERESARLADLLRELANQVEANPEVARAVFRNAKLLSTEAERRKKPETAVELDVFRVYADGGEQALRQRLEDCDLDCLKSLISHNSLDAGKLARKWKNKQRLIQLIIERVAARADKGKVFRNY